MVGISAVGAGVLFVLAHSTASAQTCHTPSQYYQSSNYVASPNVSYVTTAQPTSFVMAQPTTSFVAAPTSYVMAQPTSFVAAQTSFVTAPSSVVLQPSSLVAAPTSAASSQGATIRLRLPRGSFSSSAASAQSDDGLIEFEGDVPDCSGSQSGLNLPGFLLDLLRGGIGGDGSGGGNGAGITEDRVREIVRDELTKIAKEQQQQGTIQNALEQINGKLDGQKVMLETQSGRIDKIVTYLKSKDGMANVE